jgi:excisionase family DNA binding protein
MQVAGYRPLRRTIRHRPLLPVSFFPHSSAETLISVLQEFVSSAEGLAPATFSPLAIAPTNDSTSVWLTHPEAAKCLGISTTTLYRYVEQERIEFRKTRLSGVAADAVVQRAMRHTSPETKRRYQLGMTDRVRQAVKESNKKAYGRKKVLRFYDVRPGEKRKERYPFVTN